MGIKCCLFLLISYLYLPAAAQPSADSGLKKNQILLPTEKDLPLLQYRIDTATQSGNWITASNLSNQMSEFYSRRFQYEEAERFTLQAIDFARKANNVKSQIVNFNNLGYNHSRRFEYPKATEYFLQALRLTRESSYPNLEVNINIGLGAIYKYLEDYDRALQYFLPAYKVAQQFTGDTVNNLLSNLLINMGNCEDRRGNHRQGIFYYNKYLALKPNDRYIQVLAYNNIAFALLKLNEVDSAEALYTNAFAVEDTSRNPMGRAYSYYNFSMIAFARKEYQKAITLATKAKTGSQKYRLKNQEWLCDKILADCYQLTGNFQLANENITAYTTIRDSIFLRQRIDRVGVLDAAYRFELETGKKQQQITLLQKDNDVKALQVITLADKNRISELQLANVNKEKILAQLQLSNVNKQKTLAQLELNNLQQKDLLSQLKLENYNKANTVANIQLRSLNQQMQLSKLELSLQRRNQLLMGAGIGMLFFVFIFFYRRYRYKKLMELEKIRSGIAADFHDDLGSTLSSIALHSEIALHNTETNPQQMQKILMQIGESSRTTVSAMHDMIWSIQPQHDNMEQLILRMQEYAYPIAEVKNIDLLFHADEAVKHVRPSMDMRKNMYLIFKETLNNAFKYAQASHINVQLTKKDNLLKLEIEDDGKGFNLSSARQGNGLRNMHKRAEQSNGKLILNSHNGKGTQMIYSCPIV